MKKIITTMLLFLSFNIFAKDKVLFIDANKNPTEIKVARDFAKASGKELIVYPSTGKKIDDKELAALFDKHEFSTIHLSGHSGELMFYGENGSVDLESFIEDIKDKPSVQNIQSLYLLGCNSGNKSKINFWKGALPNLKFIAGFDGTAPVGTNPNGLTYYADLLKNEDNILRSANANEIKKKLTQIKKITSFPTSLLIKCNEQDDYLFQPKTILGESFIRFNIKECDELLKKYNSNYHDKIKALVYGDKEPKKESAQNLKEYYEATRQKEHCEEGESEALAANQVLFLRFMSEFDTNFSNYYQTMLSTLVDQLKKISSNIPEHVAKQIELRTALKNKLESDPQFMNEVIATNKKNIDEIIETATKNPAIKRCMDAYEHKATISDSELENSCQGRNINESIRMKQAVHLIARRNILNDKERFSRMLKSQVDDEIDSLNDNKGDLQKKLDHYILILEKIKSNPKEVTRQEIYSIQSYTFLEKVGVNPKLVNDYGRILQSYASLDPTIFPYSWYDKPHGEAIESPLNGLDISNDFSKASEYDTGNIIFRL